MAKIPSVTPQCPMETALNLLSGKWTLKILWQLSQYPFHFNELQRALITISPKALSQELRRLEQAAIIEREVIPDLPPRTIYSLSATGRTLQPVLKQLCDWGKAYSSRQIDRSI